MSSRELKLSGWWTFAAILLAISGTLNVIWGISAIGTRTSSPQHAHYVAGNLRAWGWIAVILGALELVAAGSLFGGGKFGRWFGIFAAAFTSIAALLSIPPTRSGRSASSRSRSSSSTSWSGGHATGLGRLPHREAEQPAVTRSIAGQPQRGVGAAADRGQEARRKRRCCQARDRSGVDLPDQAVPALGVRDHPDAAARGQRQHRDAVAERDRRAVGAACRVDALQVSEVGSGLPRSRTG